MLAAVGKAPGDVETPSSADDRRASDEVMGLSDSWESGSYKFLRGVRRIVAAASEGIVDDVEECVSDAMMRAWREMKEDATPTSPVRSPSIPRSRPLIVSRSHKIPFASKSSRTSDDTCSFMKKH
jgi:hypothetical protein